MCKERSHAIVSIKHTFTESRLLTWKRELLNVPNYLSRIKHTLFHNFPIACSKKYFTSLFPGSLFRMPSRINKPRGLYFSKALFEGLIHGEAYFRNFTVHSVSIFQSVDSPLDALVCTCTSLTKSKENERLLSV